jgi:hypothetical protein
MVKMTCFRFNLDNPEHAKAWHHLHDFDKDKVKSGNTAVIRAVNEYFDRMQKLEDDPYFENREREVRFVGQIVSEVGKVFTAEMPKLLASLLLSLNQGFSMPQTTVSIETEHGTGAAVDENTDFSAIDLDFIGG